MPSTRRRWLWLWGLVLAVSAGLLVGLLGLGFGLCTEAGRDRVLDALIAQLPEGRLRIGAREGTLTGDLRLHDVVYTDEQRRIELERLDLRLGRPDVSSRVLRLRLLALTGLRIEPRADAPETPPKPWPELLQAFEWPFALQIDRLQVEAAAGRLDGSLRVDPRRGFASRLHLDLSHRGGPQGRFWLEGDLDAGQAGFEGQIEGPLQLALRWRDATDPAGLPFELSGRFEHEALAVELLDSQLRLGDGLLQVEAMALSLLDGRLDLRGHYRLDDGHLQLEARAEDLGWGEGEAQVRAEGGATLQGRWSDWQGELALALRRADETAELSGQARGDAAGIVLAPFELATAAGRLSGEARLQHDADRSLAVDARLQGFDPGWLLPDWPGRLDGRLRLQAALPESAPPRYRLALTGLRGPLRGQPVAAELHLETDAQGQQLRLELEAGTGRLALNGRLSPVLEGQVEARDFDLGPWVEGLRGRLDGRMDWRSGTLRPQVRIDARLRDAGWNELALRQLSAQGELPGRGPGHLLLQAEALSGLAGLPPTGGRLRLQGDWTRPGPGRQAFDLSDIDLQLGRWPALHLLAPALLHHDRAGWRLPRPACFALGEPGRLCIEGDAGDLRLSGEALELATFIALLPDPEGLPVEPQGRFDLQARRLQTAAGPRLELELQSDEGRLRLDEAEAGTGELELGWRQLRFGLVQDGGWQTRLGADLQPQGRIDAELAIDPAGALAGSAALRIDDLAVLELLSADLAAPRGRIEGRLVLSGRREAPLWSGAVTAAPLSVELPALGIAIRDGSLQLAADEAGRLRLSGHLPSGEGALRLEGEWRQASREGRLSLQGSEVRVLDTAEGRVWVSPALELAVGAERLRLRGRVDVPRAVLNLDHLGGDTRLSPDVVVLDAPAAADRPAERLQADVRFVFGEDVRLRGQGFEGRVGGELRVRDRPGREPRGSGTLNLDGTLRAYGQTLELTQGALRWANSPLDAPQLDVRAERPDADPPVGVLLTGNARAPVVELWSQPPLPQAEALSWLMFGRPLAATDGRDAAQLEQAATALGGSALAQALAGQIGFDSASLGPSRGLDGTVLTVGKRVTPRLYLSYGMALSGAGQVVSVTWTLRRWLAARLEAGREQRLELEATVERD